MFVKEKHCKSVIVPVIPINCKVSLKASYQLNLLDKTPSFNPFSRPAVINWFRPGCWRQVFLSSLISGMSEKSSDWGLMMISVLTTQADSLRLRWLLNILGDWRQRCWVRAAPRPAVTESGNTDFRPPDTPASQPPAAHHRISRGNTADCWETSAFLTRCGGVWPAVNQCQWSVPP